MVDYRVRMSDRFLEAAIMGAIEAYCHGDGFQTEIETIGPIWGHRRLKGNDQIIFLERLAVSLSADRETDSVTPKAEATALMAEVMERLAPELTLLGDFHSHPYKDRDEVSRNKGFEFSDGDFNAFLADNDLWERNPAGPVMMVITMCKLNRVHETGGKMIRYNIWQFDLGQYRFWINVCIGYLDEHGRRQHSGNKRSSVWLDLDSRFFNLSGDRVGVKQI